jgi:hypothetical protein
MCMGNARRAAATVRRRPFRGLVATGGQKLRLILKPELNESQESVALPLWSL